MDQVEEIKQKLDIAEVIGGYLQLKQAGRNLKASCPFHQEKTASFMVSPEKGIWHCFGCGQGGDVIKFVMQMEGLDFRAALEVLANRAGIDLKPLRGEKGNSKIKDRLHQANALAARYFQASLAKNRPALEYLVKQRGITTTTLKQFAIGYAPDSWEGLIRLLQKNGFTEEELLKAGLAGKKRGLYDYFRGRVMLPIYDTTQRVIGFTGRVLDDSEPKYLNSPQTLLYDKSRAIYGLHLAKEAIRQADEVVLVEGNLDVVSSYQAGVKQVVAASGTALTIDQLKALSRLTKNIKLAFDADAAGLAATERAIELGQKLGLTLRMVELPAGVKDPDDLIRSNVESWRSAIKDASYIVDYLFDRFEREFDVSTAVGKRQFADRLAVTLKRLGDPVEQDHYVKRLADLTGVSEEAVRQKIEQADLSAAVTFVHPTRSNPVSIIEPSQPAPAKQLLEESVLAINLAWPDLRISLDDLEESDFSDERAAIFKILKGNPQTSAVSELPELSDYVKILTLRGEEEFGSLAPADRSLEAFGLSRRLQTVSNKDTKKQLSQQLREAEKSGDTKLARSLLVKYQELSREEV